MQPYQGINTSLYHTLDAASIQHLEHAVVLTDLGAYSEAQCLFDKELRFCRLNPVVVLARAELVLRQLKYGLLFRILEEALVTAESDCLDIDRAEFRLMYLLRGFAILSHRGIKDPPLEEIHRAKEWLKNVPVAEYTDIQVSIVHVKNRVISEYPLGELCKEVCSHRIIRPNVYVVNVYW